MEIRSGIRGVAKTHLAVGEDEENNHCAGAVIGVGEAHLHRNPAFLGASVTLGLVPVLVLARWRCRWTGGVQAVVSRACQTRRY